MVVDLPPTLTKVGKENRPACTLYGIMWDQIGLRSDIWLI